MITKSQMKATQKYVTKSYDRINFYTPKGQKDILKKKAEAEGKSLNQYIIDKLEIK